MSGCPPAWAVVGWLEYPKIWDFALASSVPGPNAMPRPTQSTRPSAARNLAIPVLLMLVSRSIARSATFAPLSRALVFGVALLLRPLAAVLAVLAVGAMLRLLDVAAASQRGRAADHRLRGGAALGAVALVRCRA